MFVVNMGGLLFEKKNMGGLFSPTVNTPQIGLCIAERYLDAVCFSAFLLLHEH